MTSDQLSGIRKYFVEYVVAVQMIAIGFLAREVIGLHNEMIALQAQQIEKNNEALYQSTNATQQFLNYQNNHIK